MRVERSKLARWVFVAFAAIAGFLWITEHRADHFGPLHYVLLALCPLLLYLLVRHEEGKSSDGAAPTRTERQDPSEEAR